MLIPHYLYVYMLRQSTKWSSLLFMQVGDNSWIWGRSGREEKGGKVEVRE